MVARTGHGRRGRRTANRGRIKQARQLLLCATLVILVNS
jgi:hypothetical protein